MRRAAKIDDNQTAIVKALRKAGCEVMSLAMVGGGCPDLLVGRFCNGTTGNLYMLEVKDGSKPPSKQRLTPHQVAFHKHWPVQVVRDEAEALRAVGL